MTKRAGSNIVRQKSMTWTPTRLCLPPKSGAIVGLHTAMVGCSPFLKAELTLTGAEVSNLMTTHDSDILGSSLLDAGLSHLHGVAENGATSVSFQAVHAARNIESVM